HAAWVRVDIEVHPGDRWFHCGQLLTDPFQLFGLDPGCDQQGVCLTGLTADTDDDVAGDSTMPPLDESRNFALFQHAKQRSRHLVTDFVVNWALLHGKDLAAVHSVVPQDQAALVAADWKMDLGPRAPRIGWANHRQDRQKEA